MSAATGPQDGRKLASLSLAALGVVYGDIGTSPLYALRECFYGSEAIGVSHPNVLGVLSLVLWSLILVVSIKYLTFVLRADNRGEGGILALTALVTPIQASARGGGRWLLVLLGMFGAALLYGDGMITPAISVLSAVEGLGVATPVFTPYVIPITIIILIGLFMFQHHGTARVGAVFGPVTCLWFLVLGVLGVANIAKEPAVLAAVSPLHAIGFFLRNGGKGFLVLGAVFLAVTGGEALYADMGHFGTKPIRLVWFGLVLPALLLNYFGQGALLLDNPAAVGNPFYRLGPGWALLPMVALSTAATVIASQAVISGAFSLSVQAVQLGYSPRLRIDHTSAEEKGQIYVPLINWGLMLACIGLVIGFRSSNNLAAAYGVAVTTTMGVTTLLFYVVARDRWRWRPAPAVLLAGCFLIIDLAFFGANMMKVAHGGWFPLAVAAGAFILMTTWKRGREVLARRLHKGWHPIEGFVRDIEKQMPMRVPGAAVYMTGNPDFTPPALFHNLRHNKVLHEQIVILGVRTEEIPHVEAAERVKIESLGLGFYRMVVRYGFMESPNIPEVLERLHVPGLDLKITETTFFLGRETLVIGEERVMPKWRKGLFAWMSRNARGATSFFHLPPGRVVEIGMHIEL
ncbi:MAG: potassium transporter Kup [Desulfobacteraceae bacterium]|nr:potassium transporter Kup [Desulfobacteraceae bacterium]